MTENTNLLPKQEKYLQLPIPSINNAKVSERNMLKVGPDAKHFSLGWGHSILAYQKGLGPLLEDMTYEVQFAQKGEAKPEKNRFVNIDIDTLVKNPLFQKDPIKQQNCFL